MGTDLRSVELTLSTYLQRAPTHSLNHIKLVDAHAIAVMKIMAISQRGKKRDFFDLYWYLKHENNFSIIISDVKRYYPNKQHNLHHFLKSLIYFEDAEADPDPIIFFDATWEQVKKYFEIHVPLAAKTILELE